MEVMRAYLRMRSTLPVVSLLLLSGMYLWLKAAHSNLHRFQNEELFNSNVNIDILVHLTAPGS